MNITPRAFSDALKAALVSEKPLRLTLIDGSEHRVLLPVSITQKKVEFAGPYFMDQRVVVAWNEIASLEIAGQEAALHDRLTALLLKVELAEESRGPKRAVFKPRNAVATARR